MLWFLPDSREKLNKKTLEHVDGIQVKASKILGINRNTLRKKIKELGISGY